MSCQLFRMREQGQLFLLNGPKPREVDIVVPEAILKFVQLFPYLQGLERARVLFSQTKKLRLYLENTSEIVDLLRAL